MRPKVQCVWLQTCNCLSLYKRNFHKEWVNPHYFPFIDAIRIVCQLKCYKETDDGNWIAVIEEVLFPLRLNVFHYVRNMARHCFVVSSEAVSELIGKVVNRSIFVPS